METKRDYNGDIPIQRLVIEYIPYKRNVLDIYQK